MASYIALLRKDRRTHYGVSFPDFPGCVTAGRTLEEARQMAVEALALHLEGLEAEDLLVPAASTLDEILRHPEHRDGVPFLVDVEPRTKVVRVNITLDVNVLQQIDAYTEKIGASRSAFLANAALYQLGQAGGPAKRTRRAS